MIGCRCTDHVVRDPAAQRPSSGEAVDEAVDVVLLGTGAADPYPRAGCGCAACRAARARGISRGPTAALVDGVLLLQAGPGIRHVASVATDGLRHRPLDVSDPTATAAGRSVRLGEHVVRVLGGGCSAVLDVSGPDGRRLLWAAHTGPLPEATLDAMAGVAFDAVFLDDVYGDDAAPDGAGHLDLSGFARTLAELRARGAVTARTRVCAVNIGHGNPAPDELAARLAAWGADAPADGSRLVLGDLAAGGDCGARRALVLGGARSGKSVFAERLLLAEPAVTYVATAAPQPADPEWELRVAAHRARRPAHWTTIESGDLDAVIRTGRGPFLVDCVSLWLTRVLDETGAWEDADRGIEEAVSARIDAFVTAWANTTERIVAVSSEVGLGIVPVGAGTRRYRDHLGALNARLAATADDVWLVTAGIPQRLK